MPQVKYISPELLKKKFTCPLCHTLAAQRWDFFISTVFPEAMYRHVVGDSRVYISHCKICKEKCLWHGERLMYPDIEAAPSPNEGLSPEVMKIYREAASVKQKSPRAATALLRLALERLCDELGGDGKDLYEKIESLVKKNPELLQVKEAMNVIRFIGNAGLHPGTIQINENPELVEEMFELINLIADLIVARKRQAEIVNRVNALKEKKAK